MTVAMAAIATGKLVQDSSVCRQSSIIKTHTYIESDKISNTWKKL